MTSQESIRRELPAGTELQDGKYVIERVIGSGGFGITYYGRHTRLKQFYAIKEFFINGRCVRGSSEHTVLLQNISQEAFDHFRSKFDEEAQTLAKLNHPNIVKVVDILEENGTSYMVMPFIEGTSLEKMVKKGGPLEYDLAVNYLGQIAEAVKYIHERNILHRDIKPDNIMITPDNKAMLIDFGSAREFVQDQTQHQTAILTPGYAPIEQHSSTSRKGSYTDIYSLGAVFYYLLTGQVPLEATTRSLEKMPEPKQLNPEIPDDANRTIMKAMQMKPENRHQTVDDFMADLLGHKPSEMVDETNLLASTSSPRTDAPMTKHVATDADGNRSTEKQSSSKKWLIIGAVIAAIAVVAILAMGGKSDDTKREIPSNSLNKANPLNTSGLAEESTVLIEEEFISGYPMVWVEGGTFHRGNSYAEPGDPEYAAPGDSVTVTGFWIGKYEVTQRLWKDIMEENPSIFSGNPDCPVENITPKQAQEFIEKLNQKYGTNMMLPSEAEWEYAASGGRYSKGLTYAGGHKAAWYEENSKGYTHSVGSLEPNELGLYDMSGNVAEICRDYYDPEYYSRSVGAVDPVNTQPVESVAVRGGSYSDEDFYIMISTRAHLTLDNYYSGIGLRLIQKTKDNINNQL